MQWRSGEGALDSLEPCTDNAGRVGVKRDPADWSVRITVRLRQNKLYSS